MPRKKPVSAALAKQKAAKKAKVEKKAEKRETKKKGPADEEEDLDAVLAKLAKDWETKHKINEETVAGPPSQRANASLTPCPTGNHLWCIGGEFFSDDGKAYFYNDVYRYSPEKDEWRCYTSPNAPGPRSAHSVVGSPAGGGKLFLFGGEFSSLSQNTFHHYRDFWVFDVATHGWDRIETKIKPSARSGHRMALWKHFLVLFGGFVDIGVRTNYLNDLWIFDTQEYKWFQVEFGPNDRIPQARSGFSFLPILDGFILHGGYTKTYTQGKRPVGMALEDTWFLRMSTNLKDVKWEKRKKIGYPPKPPRSGCTMALWPSKAIGVLFGGVSDVDKDEEQLESEFYSDMYGYQTSGTGRWIALGLRKRKETGSKKTKPIHNTLLKAREIADQEDLMDVEEVDIDEEAIVMTEDVPPAAAGSSTRPETSLPSSFTNSNEVPHARYNAMLAILRNTLYIYGGIYEGGSKEYTLDDFWSIALDKMDGFSCLRGLSVSSLEIADSDSEGDSEEEESDGDGDEEEGVQEDPNDDHEAEAELQVNETPEDIQKLAELRLKATQFIGSSTDANRSAADQLSTPLPGESLAVFYARSKDYWAQKAHEYSDNRGKLLRRDGFALAEEKYDDYKPILAEVEKILSEAGLDDAEMRATTSGGTGTINRNRR